MSYLLLVDLLVLYYLVFHFLPFVYLLASYLLVVVDVIVALFVLIFLRTGLKTFQPIVDRIHHIFWKWTANSINIEVEKYIVVIIDYLFQFLVLLRLGLHHLHIHHLLLIVDLINWVSRTVCSLGRIQRQKLRRTTSIVATLLHLDHLFRLANIHDRSVILGLCQIILQILKLIYLFLFHLEIDVLFDHTYTNIVPRFML